VLIFINNYFLTQMQDNIALYPAILILIILLLAFILQIYCKPFHPDFYFLNTIEELSLLISSLTVSCVLIIISSIIENDTQILLIIFCILINSIFFIIWIKLYYSLYLKKKLGKFSASLVHEKKR